MSTILGILALWLMPIQTPSYKAIIPSQSVANAQKLPPLQIFSEQLVFATSTEQTTLLASSTPYIEQLIIKYSKQYGADQLLALNIAWAESTFKNIPNLYYDGENGYYTAYGIFQETRTFYKRYCGDPIERMDIEKNIECAVKVLAMSDGYLHWMESYELDGKGWKYPKYSSILNNT